MGKPKIRFKGYEDDWEQRKVSEIGNIVTGSTPKTSISDNYGGEFLFVSPADIQENRYVDETITTLTKKGFDQGRKIREKASLFVSIGSTIGKVAQTSQESTTNQQINAVEPYDNFDDDFIFTSLENISGSIKAIASNQAVPIVNKTTFGETEIKVPSELAEQQKIGAYFRNLDHLITLHQRKCYRFIDIALDAWEQRKLDGWGTFYYGRSCPKWSVTEDATIPCIRYGELYTKFGAKIDRVYSYTNMPPENLRFSKGTEVLIPRVGEDPMDYNHCTWLSMPDVAIGEMISVFNTDNNPLFTATMFNATLQNEFAMRVEGGSVTNLYFEKLKNIEVSFPSIQEQEKIAAYFENLDHLITLHQRKCEETKSLKKYMLQKMFPENGKCVPKIRFSGFSDDWEQRRLGNVLLSLQNNTLSRANLSDESGIAKNVHYGDVLIKFGEVLDVRKEKLPMITDENVLSKYKASFLQNGDVIVADTAEDSTVGKCSEIAGLNDEVVLSGLHTIPYRPIEKFASGYLGYYLNSGAYHNQLIPLMQGIKVTSISKSAMQNTDIDYPKSQEEQGKIGAYFKSLDEMITLHQHKCDELQKLKKFMLQNMFV